jgi:prophage regulatory protein
MAEAIAVTPTIWRRRQVQDKVGLSRSTLYARIAAGLWPKPVSLGLRCVGWPDTEVAEVIAARIAGKSDNDIRSLVERIEARRGGGAR